MDLTPVSTGEEAAAWLAVHNSAVAARAWSPAALTTLLAGAPDHRQTILRDERSTPIGAGLAVVEAGLVMAWVSIATGERGRGHGGSVWTDLFAWSPDLPIEVRVEAADDWSTAFARKRGLSIVRHEPRLVRHLTHESDAPPGDPSTAAVRTLALSEQPDLVGELWRIAEQRPRIEGSLSATAWQERFLVLEVGGTRYTTVALVDDEVVGFATLLVNGAFPNVAAHVGTFVDQTSTGRGVASALKEEQVRWALAQGFTRLEASSDPDNVAKARLYARHGYERVPGWYLMTAR